MLFSTSNYGWDNVLELGFVMTDILNYNQLIEQTSGIVHRNLVLVKVVERQERQITVLP